MPINFKGSQWRKHNGEGVVYIITIITSIFVFYESNLHEHGTILLMWYFSLVLSWPSWFSLYFSATDGSCAMVGGVSRSVPSSPGERSEKFTKDDGSQGCLDGGTTEIRFQNKVYFCHLLCYKRRCKKHPKFGGGGPSISWPKVENTDASKISE